MSENHRPEIKGSVATTLAAWAQETQDAFQAAGADPNDVVPQIIDTLISLAYYMARRSAKVNPLQFLHIVIETLEEDIEIIQVPSEETEEAKH
jgi:hypothetical protein